MRDPSIRRGRCRECKREFIQEGRGNTRFYCTQACRARRYYKQNPEKAKERMRGRYAKNPQRYRAYRVEKYRKRKLRVVTWTHVDLPELAVKLAPSFSGAGEDIGGLLGDYELRHLLADFEDEEGNL